ncbi:MAG: hypothetical protein JWP37_1600 [Mucilaginibacter sp.]|nr:hypothetical protein [Mucilaginibacter sp.]
MKINKEWHLAHPMPKNPTFEQRADGTSNIKKTVPAGQLKESWQRK